ncbi:unnamed protein product [Vicia faba]|uniref:Uncharacterized protein n=1 Tax=Vicia faba TaxID=3906 RepID=A0AAV0ZT15_VICFA|nr:unnamed protein product [Vicia faba]
MQPLILHCSTSLSPPLTSINIRLKLFDESSTPHLNTTRLFLFISNSQASTLACDMLKLGMNTRGMKFLEESRLSCELTWLNRTSGSLCNSRFDDSGDAPLGTMEAWSKDNRKHEDNFHMFFKHCIIICNSL